MTMETNQEKKEKSKSKKLMLLSDYMAPLKENFYHVEFELYFKRSAADDNVPPSVKTAKYIAVDNRLTEYGVKYLTPWIDIADVEFDVNTGDFSLLSFRALRGKINLIQLRNGDIAYADQYRMQKLFLMETGLQLVKLQESILKGTQDKFFKNFQGTNYLTEVICSKYNSYATFVSGAKELIHDIASGKMQQLSLK